VPDALAGARVACIAERGMTQAVEALAADGCELTENQRFWVDVGVAHLATLQTLSEAGWITGPA
jgi:hypothetical protein